MKNEYTMKNVIDGIGHDLAGWKGSLYRNGKKVADINDDGYGGNTDFHWIDWKLAKDGNKWNETPEEKIFKKYVEELKVIKEKEFVPSSDPKDFLGKKFLFDAEIFVSELANDFLEIKNMKQMCRKGLHFQIDKEIGSDKWWVIPKIKYKDNPQKIEEHLAKKYPNQKIRILNKELGVC